MPEFTSIAPRYDAERSGSSIDSRKFESSDFLPTIGIIEGLQFE